MKRKHLIVGKIVSLGCVFLLFSGCGSDKEEVPGKPKVEKRKIVSSGQTASTRSTPEKTGAAKKPEVKRVAVSAPAQTASQKEKPSSEKPPKVAKTDTILSIGSAVKADAVSLKQKAAQPAVVPASKMEKKPDVVPKTTPATAAPPEAPTKPAIQPGQIVTTPQNIPSEQAALILRTVTSSYKTEGRIDPFVPLLKTKETKKQEQAERRKKPKRRLTPLEKVDLDQLKLVGVILAPSGNMALVEEASGKGYIVSVGTRIGINSGKISEIMQDRIIVDEEIEDVTGKITKEKRPLKIQKSPGD
jgi:type IV pilus assembly protein PilP